MRTLWREGGAFRPPRPSLSTLGTGGCLLCPARAHSPPPLLRTQGDSLREDYGLIPSRSHTRLQNWRGAEEESRDPVAALPTPPHPCGSSGSQRLPGAHHAPLP